MSFTASNCTACPLHKRRNNEVAGTINRESLITIVAPHPYFAEDQIGRAFTGDEARLIRAGFTEARNVHLAFNPKNRDKIEQINIGLTYVNRCRPFDDKFGSVPVPREYAMACRGNFDEAVRLMGSRVFIYSGQHTAKLLNVKKPRFVIPGVDFIVYNGGKESPHYKTMVRCMIEAIKEAVE